MAVPAKKPGPSARCAALAAPWGAEERHEDLAQIGAPLDLGLEHEQRDPHPHDPRSQDERFDGAKTPAAMPFSKICSATGTTGSRTRPKWPSRIVPTSSTCCSIVRA